jgi:recombination protein RecA
VIFINQIRMKIGVMYGNPETTTGGNALKFYASVRLDIRRTGQIKERDEVIGSETRVKVVKNKVAPPFKQVQFDIIYGEGISKTGELIELGVKAGVIDKSGLLVRLRLAEDRPGQGSRATVLERERSGGARYRGQDPRQVERGGGRDVLAADR